jgi:hypothetical protein
LGCFGKQLKLVRSAEFDPASNRPILGVGIGAPHGLERLEIEPDVERPTDTDGIVYARLDSSKDWWVELAKELEAAGIEVDRTAIR